MATQVHSMLYSLQVLWKFYLLGLACWFNGYIFTSQALGSYIGDGWYPGCSTCHSVSCLWSIKAAEDGPKPWDPETACETQKKLVASGFREIQFLQLQPSGPLWISSALTMKATIQLSQAGRIPIYLRQDYCFWWIRPLKGKSNPHMQ